MRTLSLKWSIFVFYLLFGLLPLGVISYLTMTSYTRTITQLTDQHLSELLLRVAEQTDDRCYNLFKYLDLMAKFPYVQLSFLQYPHAGQRSTVQEKLERFRINTQAFSRITLYSNQGQVVAATPGFSSGEAARPLPPEQVTRLAAYSYAHLEDLDHQPPRLLLFKRVYDYRNPSRPVGLACAETPLSRLLSFTRDMGLGPEVAKIVVDSQGRRLLEVWPAGLLKRGGLREYSASLPLLDWRILVRIPKKVLYRDVVRARYNTLAFAALVALVALVAVALFSRLVTRPLETIIEGTRRFAAGELDYRLPEPRGRETRRLARAFNQMAAQLEKRQAELVQAGKLASLGLLSAGFAHEVRNPLAGIKTSAQVLQRRARDQQDRSLAQGISQEVDRLNHLVGELLHLARPRPSRQVPCRLGPIVERALALLQPRLDRKGVQVANHLEEITLHADPDQVLQVVINLLLNALQAVPPGRGIITLQGGRDAAGRPRLVVADNGPGIPPEILGRIFDPFVSLAEEGTGLGLAIVQSLLRQNGAKVEAESTPGQGSRFIVTFQGRRQKPQEREHG